MYYFIDRLCTPASAFVCVCVCVCVATVRVASEVK